MAKEMPFDEDTMTLIMGLGGPSEPGQHGRREVPMPEMDSIDIITQIRDLCEEFLMKAGKGKPESEGPGKGEKPEFGKEEEKPEEEEE